MIYMWYMLYVMSGTHLPILGDSTSPKELSLLPVRKNSKTRSNLIMWLDHPLSDYFSPSLNGKSMKQWMKTRTLRWNITSKPFPSCCSTCKIWFQVKFFAKRWLETKLEAHYNLFQLLCGQLIETHIEVCLCRESLPLCSLVNTRHSLLRKVAEVCSESL